jgi:hypothetical protein
MLIIFEALHSDHSFHKNPSYTLQLRWHVNPNFT